MLLGNCFKAMILVKSTRVPAVTQTLNLTSIRVLYGKVTFANKFSSSLKIVIVNRNIFQLVSITYILKIINVCKTMLNMEKTVQMSDFHSYAVLLLWVKLCYGINILLRNKWRAGLQSCS